MLTSEAFQGVKATGNIAPKLATIDRKGGKNSGIENLFLVVKATSDVFYILAVLPAKLLACEQAFINFHFQPGNRRKPQSKNCHCKQEMRQPFVSYPHRAKPNMPVTLAF